jgi:hypothetical protein
MTQQKEHPNLLAGEHHGATSECAECGEVFCGVKPFDEHRVGEHGLLTGATRRRCLRPTEMAVKGMTRCGRGRWSAVSSSATRARRAAA